MSVPPDRRDGRNRPPKPKFRASPRLSEEVADAIRTLIVTGQVRGGDFLRLEQMASELGVSRTPVREALLLLRAEGFVELQPRKGFIASSVRRRDIEDLFMVQGSISGELAARAAEVITPEALERVRDLHTQMAEQVTEDDRAEAKRLTHEFHRTINKAADSPKLAWILGTVARYPDKFFESVLEWVDHSVHDHEQIIEALSDRDSDKARETVVVHFGNVAKILIRHVDERGLWTD